MFSYFKSKEFFLSIFGLITAGILGYLFVFYLFLPFYTRHGSSILVPDVSGKNLTEAQKILSKSNLSWEIRDSIYSVDIPAMNVVKQYPVPLSTVKPGRAVFLTINKITPPSVKLPKLVDISVYQAKSRLESWKLGIKEIKKVPDIAQNVVLKVLYNGKEVKEGFVLPQGSQLSLIVGEGLKKNLVEVPNLLGLTLENAEAELRRNGLKLGAKTYDVAAKGQSGKIFKQAPTSADSATVQEGSDVDVWIYGRE